MLCNAINHMMRCDLHGRLMVSVLACCSGVAEAYGETDGMKSLCASSVLKCGVVDFKT